MLSASPETHLTGDGSGSSRKAAGTAAVPGPVSLPRSPRSAYSDALLHGGEVLISDRNRKLSLLGKIERRFMTPSKFSHDAGTAWGRVIHLWVRH